MGMFVMYKDKVVHVYDNHLGRSIPKTWVEAGTYKVIRKFDDDRILIQLNDRPRQVTVIKKELGDLYDQVQG